MEGEYIRGPKGIGVYAGGGNTLDESDGGGGGGTDWAGLLDTAASFVPGGAEAEAAWGIFQSIVHFFSGGPSRWDTAGPGVHDFFHYHAEQAFQDWLDVKNPAAYGDLNACKAARYFWTYTGAPGNVPSIAPGFLRQIFDPIYTLPTTADMNTMCQGMGIDLPASLIKHVQNGYANTPEALNTLNPNFIVAIPGYGANVQGIIEDTIDAIEGGDALTDEQADVGEGLLRDSDAEQKRDNTMTLISAAGLLFTLAKAS